MVCYVGGSHQGVYTTNLHYGFRDCLYKRNIYHEFYKGHPDCRIHFEILMMSFAWEICITTFAQGVLSVSPTQKI